MNTTNPMDYRNHVWRCLKGEQTYSSWMPSLKEVYVNAVILCVVNILLTFSTTFLNVITVLAYWRSSQLQKKTSYFLIMLLSLSDLAVGAVCNPTFTILLVVDIQGGNRCPTFAVLTVVTTLSSMSLTLLFWLNVERYLGIVHPIFHRNKVTKSKVLIASFISWCLVVVTSCTFFIDTKVVSMILSIELSLFIIILIYIYVRIFLVSRASARNPISVHAETTSKKAFLRNIKLAKSCLIVVGCTFLCFVPTVVTSSLWKLPVVGSILWSWSATFVFASSTLNSVIFFWRNHVLRSEAKKVLWQANKDWS